MEAPFHTLERLGLKASKKLGQNFLIHENTAKKIVAFANPKPLSTVIEIGPGLGAITQVMLENHTVIAIEKDVHLAAFLKEKFKTNKNFHLFCADALGYDFLSLAKSHPPPFHVIANLPYNISTPLLHVFLEHKTLFSKLNFLLQAEVVDRICAVPNTKDYGRLSIGLQMVCETEAGPKIAPHQFFPKPDVDSRLVALTPREKPLIEPNLQEDFLNFVSKVFQQRRKTLKASLKWGQKPCPESLRPLLLKRPENASIEALFSLFNHFNMLR